ncbi:MAG: SGNH/GDSL hydrolase family protein [Mangrovibacterium sp.]|nr:SGNH/GDSL hydrolase family protein [Mangrovibacterium sp.]
MKKNTFLYVFVFIALLFPSGLKAENDTLKYVDASTFELIGKGFSDTENLYERLPASLKDKTRPAVWSLSKNCSGLAIRFRTNSRIIAARWELTGDVTMNHFAPTGIKGVDLYCLEKGKWLFVNSGRPNGKVSRSVIVKNMEGKEKEYMLYLPLYDGVSRLEIGVEQAALIDNPRIDSPRKDKPVVVYGTSITQGGCASRAGMSYTSQLSRMLDRQFINLGFSGNGKLDLEVAEAMSGIDASCFVIDCVPNVSAGLMKEKYVRFYEVIREKNPETPVLMAENPRYTHMAFDQKTRAAVHEKNSLLKGFYQELKKKGDRHLYYLKAGGMTGDDLEGTVDGVHLTDLGFKRQAGHFYPALRKIIK